MGNPPQDNAPSGKPGRSRRRWIWYVAGSILLLAIPLVVGSFLSVSTRPPSPIATSPAPTERPPQESQPAAPPSASEGEGGGGAPTEAGPPPPPNEVAAKPEPAAIPQFPWPPPRASATVVLPAAFLRPAGAALHFGDVDHTLTSALDSCGYFDRSYYAVPDGFAIVTRLEQMESDGTSKTPPDRWSLEFKPLERFSLQSYIRALFTANPGFYRIIVFVVTSQSFSQSPSGVGRDEALKWLQGGLDRLPAELAGRDFTDQYACTALIYQFEQPGSGEGAKLDMPSELPGRTHLERAKLWEALGKSAIAY